MNADAPTNLDDAPTPPAGDPAPTAAPTARVRRERPQGDRSRIGLLWYRGVKAVVSTWMAAIGGCRSTGWRNMPESGGVILVSNHLSYLDVFILGIGVRRPLNYVARSTLFLPGLGALIRSVGGFPIQREGMGASGMKETLKRLRAGGVVTLFPEGTRSRDGELGEMKSGIALLVSRAAVPVVPVGLAGTFRAWPRGRLLPRPHPIRVHYGPPILPTDLEGLDPRAVTALIRERMAESIEEARRGLARDLGA
ncbi:lysophospholipid acyltransferase family protein [Planctomyces sp. SH-PL62]|uniref:lysophospholipid acyltransferase family protein n=1 Tax=Planctomyces sp. SH-PL62 TaxID=1636152 RepID=UPI00078CE334|nr:lysophospholipid acyltransferase family protein [Planctomyces sp. SH-PL62]AMV40525.1 1-acyl-sn-glycerol-3-phosphate acyltransferase [Planctomyces sp. SH-PL62]